MTWTLVVLHFWKNHWIAVFSWQISPTKRIGGIEWHPHLTILTIRLPWQLKNQDWIANISSTRTSFHYVFMNSWWFQSIWKNISQLGSFPQVGIKMKHNLSCHHLIRWIYGFIIWLHCIVRPADRSICQRRRIAQSLPVHGQNFALGQGAYELGSLPTQYLDVSQEVRING